MQPSVTCVIPAHNEGAGIFDTLLEIDAKAPEMAEPLRVFVSEDGSSDNTRAEVERAQACAEHISIILSDPSERLGYSRAVQRGIQECTTEIVWFMDADGQYDPADFEALSRSVRPGLIVVGYRNPRADSARRRFYSSLFGLAYRATGGPKLRDPSTPFVIARTSDVASFAQATWHLSYGFWWEFEMRVHAAGLEVLEVPITHRQRLEGDTQVYTPRRMPRIIGSHLAGLLALRRELRHERSPGIRAT